MQERITISVDDVFLKRVDKFKKDNHRSNRSDALREMVRLIDNNTKPSSRVRGRSKSIR